MVSEITESTDLTLPGNECLNDTGTYIYEYHNIGYCGFDRTAHKCFCFRSV